MTIWSRYKKHRLGMIALALFSCLVLLAIYAPFLASSKPFVVRFEGTWYFPFFRYLFYPGFYTKRIDLFYNILMFLFPIALFARKKKWVLGFLAVLQIALFFIVSKGVVKDPASTTYKHFKQESLEVIVAPFFRPYHWEDDVGGSQKLNQTLPWWELTRLNRKDLSAALLFGIRISLVVGLATVILALLLGIPLGLFAGYFAGKTDIVICRFIEIWEAMPLFFLLLLIIALTQSKSIFLVILILSLFGWTHFARYIRGEVLRQRVLPYVLAGHSLGYSHFKIMFDHILPNAIFPVLTLLPFSMMAAITSEAALSFLGLGEEGSTSLGVLMAEARVVFPGESYLLWPPAIVLTVLLVSIALVGDALRDALDPKLD